MKKKEINFICDNCGAEAHPEEMRYIENPLPVLWARLQMTWNHGVYEAVDICGDCRSEIAEALQRRRSNGS